MISVNNMMMKSLAVAGLGLIALVGGRSDGVVGLCDAHGNVGCSKWYSGYGESREWVEDRLQCLEENPGIMSWASRPDRSDKYELRVEDGSTTYSPDDFLTLVLEVKDPEWKYRGLLLHAVDETGTTVGEWEFPDEGEQMFHSPHTCPQAALHASADLKPYVVRLHWRAPSDLDEKITFRCLIKRGPANTGSFHYPNGEAGDLTLDPAPEDDEGLMVGAAGQSCDEACSAAGLECDPAGMQTLSDPIDLEAKLGDNYACPLPLVEGCANPTASHSKCTFSSDASQATCSYKRTDVQLICACKEIGTRRLSLEVEEEIPPMHNGVRTAFPLVGLLLSVLTALMVADSPLIGLGLGMIALSQLPGVQAHNWLLTSGRATNQASTTRPCRGRKTSDTHAQVGPGQHVDMVWSTGHGGANAYIVVLPADAYNELYAEELSAIFNDYIDNAPVGTNRALQNFHKRYHGDKEDRSMKTCEEILELNPNFKRIVPGDDEDFITHPHMTENQRCVWEYEDAALTNDVSVSYVSEKYPWIESVGRFPNLEHLPHDYDLVRVPLPGRHGTGHYVVYWHWRGYSDCVDVNVHDIPVPQDLIYGQDTGEYYMNRVDHCQYVQPKHILSSCHEVVAGSIDECVDELLTWAQPNGSNGYTFGKRGNPKDNNWRIGVNVVPAKLPPAVPEWMGTGGIPSGNNPVCGRSDWLELTGKGTVTTSTSYWRQKFEPNRIVMEQHRCADEDRLWKREDITFLDAIALCSESKCKGFSWKHGQDVKLTDMYKGTHTFIGCAADPVEVELTEVCEDRPSVANPNKIFRDIEGYTCNELRAGVVTSDGNVWKFCHNPNKTPKVFPPRMVDGLCMGHACCGCGFAEEDRGGIFSYYSAWTHFAKNFEEDLMGGEPEKPPVYIANINFQNSFSPLSAEESEEFPLFDAGMSFREHGKPGSGTGMHDYGWVCPGRDEEEELVEIFDMNNKKGPRPINPVLLETTAAETGARKFDYTHCPDVDHHAFWEYEVPDIGLYTVEMMIGNPEVKWDHSVQYACSIEGNQVTQNKTGTGIYKLDVEVLDGKLTFGSQSNPHNFRCDGLSWIKISKRQDLNRLPTPKWMTGAVRANPWWQMELEERTAIGAVTIDTLSNDINDCSTRWLFKGTDCPDTPILGDFNDEENDGALVGVSDEPCTGENMCPGTVCGRIERAAISCHGSYDCQLANTKYQTTIDCKGAKGKYVWVQLPGKRRVLAGVDIKVNRYLPETTSSGDPVDSDTLLCYGVHARVQTELEFEYETTNDPTDPMFYSTCYVREKKVEWLGIEEKEQENRWRFNGRCVECADVAENALMKDEPPLWHLAEPDQCKDCSAEAELCSPTDSAGSSPAIAADASPEIAADASPEIAADSSPTGPAPPPFGAEETAPAPPPFGAEQTAPAPPPFGAGSSPTLATSPDSSPTAPAPPPFGAGSSPDSSPTVTVESSPTISSAAQIRRRVRAALRRLSAGLI